MIDNKKFSFKSLKLSVVIAHFSNRWRVKVFFVPQNDERLPSFLSLLIHRKLLGKYSLNCWEISFFQKNK